MRKVTSGMAGTMHFEVRIDGVSLPCWCDIGRAHTYEDWLRAGGPNHAGRRDEFSAEPGEFLVG